MHENVVAGLAADEAEAFGVVKPFHCSLFHCVTCFYCFEFLLRRIAAGDKGIAGWRNRPSTAGESNLADNHWMCQAMRTIHFNGGGDKTNPLGRTSWRLRGEIARTFGPTDSFCRHR